MNPADLPLRDIHLPDPVGWWPPALGLWLVALIAIGLVALLVRAWRRRRAWRRSPAYLAGVELERMRANWQQHGNPQRLTEELSSWLRRVSMSLHSRRTAAGLTGRDWWRFLDSAAGTPVFGPDGGQLLAAAPYRPDGGAHAERLLVLCERWLAAVRERARRAAT